MTIVQESFKLNLIILGILRLYPTKKLTCLYKIECFAVYIILTYPVPLMGILCLLIEKNFDRFQSSYDAFTIPQAICQIIKLLPFITNGRRIKECIHSLEASIFVVKELKHQEILKKSGYICTRNAKVYLTCCVLGVVNFAFMSIYEKKLPLNVWLPLDPTQNRIIYCLVFIVIITGIMHIAVVCAVVDTLIGGLACFAAGHFQILKDILQHLDEPRENYDSKSKTAIRRTKIKKCVKYHNAILDFVKEYEKCFSVITFSELTGSAIILCFCCFQLSKVEPMTFNFFNLLSYLIIFLAEIFFYCYYGTILHEESDSITTAIYMSEWYSYDVQSQKDLIRIMERAKQPATVTAGKILELSLATFTLVLRRAYSLLAVLNNMTN